MRAEKIIEIWDKASERVPAADDDLDLVQMFASEIAKLSDRLSEQELCRLIAVGVLVYRRGFRAWEYEGGTLCQRRA